MKVNYIYHCLSNFPVTEFQAWEHILQFIGLLGKEAGLLAWQDTRKTRKLKHTVKKTLFNKLKPARLSSLL